MFGEARIHTVPVPGDCSHHFMLGLLTQAQGAVCAPRSARPSRGGGSLARRSSTGRSDLGARPRERGLGRTPRPLAELDSYDGGLRLIVSSPG